MIGTRIGQYELKRAIGAGGMGSVFYAEHIVLGTAKAIKVLLPELTSNQEIVQRFLNEARAAAAIRHRNIVRVTDFGQTPDRSSWYIEMDWNEGGTLARFLAAHGRPLSLSVIGHITAEIANGLQVAHDRDIIHRDLKPDNIWIADLDGDPHRCQILDFGVAKLGGALSDGTKTRAGMLIGTPSFMPPEALAGGAITRSADIWALGAIAYQMATGWLPYQEEPVDDYYNLTGAAIYHRQMSRAPTDPRLRNPALPTAFANVLIAALSPNPTQRHASARAFALAMAEAIPSDGFHPSGTDIVRSYARELLEIGNMLETVRAPQAIAITPATSRYRLGDRVGIGGMAEVFTGTITGAEGFSRDVAIKRVLAGFSENPMFATMFIDEARIVSRLQHPNIVSILDFDKDPEGRLFIVMEYIAGKDLAALVESGPLPASIAIFVAIEILRGLGHAHALPVVHRDVSPHNVLLSWEGAVKVSDFGIAKALDATGERSAMVKGKPAYMSPEQVNAEVLDARSDVFAVGVVMWEMLTGKRLYRGGTKETFAAILLRDAPPPSSASPHVPKDLDRVVSKLLARERADRYASAEQAIDELASCADNPRDGRGDLTRLIAQRFPSEAKVRRMPPPLEQPTGASPTANFRGQVASPTQTHAPSRKRLAFAFAIAVAVAGALVLAFSSMRSASTHHAARASDAAISNDGTALAMTPDDATAVVGKSRDAAAIEGVSGARLDAHASADAVDAGNVATLPLDAGTQVTGKPHLEVRPQSVAKGSIEIFITPWAEVTVDGSLHLGQTPVQTKLSVGPHRILIKSPNKQKTVSVTITATKTVTIDETW